MPTLVSSHRSNQCILVSGTLLTTYRDVLPVVWYLGNIFTNHYLISFIRNVPTYQFCFVFTCTSKWHRQKRILKPTSTLFTVQVLLVTNWLSGITDSLWVLVEGFTPHCLRHVEKQTKGFVGFLWYGTILYDKTFETKSLKEMMLWYLSPPIRRIYER